MTTQKILDQEFYDALSDFVDEKIVDLPTSDEAAINAMRVKIEEMTRKSTKRG